MTPFEKIEALIETRINGNSIKGNKTYEKFDDIVNTEWIYKKIDKIEIYKNFIIGEK